MPTPRPSQKKQATLTSFFTPRSSNANGNSAALLPSSSPAPSHSQQEAQSSSQLPTRSPRLPSRKRPLEDEVDQNKQRDQRAGGGDANGKASSGGGGGGRSRFARAVKRARGEIVADENEEEEEEEEEDKEDKEGDDDDNDEYVEKDAENGRKHEADEPLLPPPKKSTTTTTTTAKTITTSPLRSSGRAERYMYDERPRDDRNMSKDTAADDNSSSDDEETKRKKAELHRRFVQKLGHPDSLAKSRRRNFMLGGDLAGPLGGGDDDDGEGGDEKEDDGGGDGEGEGEEEEEEERPKGAKGGKAGKAGGRVGKAAATKKPGKLTPMEVQFLAIKREHLDTVLIVEVGYKFKFFGEDARTAARVLGIVCIPGKVRYDEHASEAHLDRFASASIPVPRLPVHVKRLVAAGLKVGVVRQMETAALKRAGDNRSAPFVRQLTNVYTKGTYIEEEEEGELAAAGGGETKAGRSTAPSTAGGYLLCMCETPVAGAGAGTDEKVVVGLLAVQPATGDILYDRFEDGFLRSEIETRLLHIAPCELLLVGELSRATTKLVTHLSGSASNVFGDRTRVERVAAPAAADAQTQVAQFYADALGDKEDNEKENEKRANLLDTVLGLPAPVTTCLAAMITHLTEYGLQHVFALTKNFGAFSTRQHMLLNGTTLESLEVYRNATDHGLRGSLLWALDKTTTRPGHRLLRKWIGRPLLDSAALRARVAAVEELLHSEGSGRREKLERLLGNARATDLERSLIRIYYGKCTRPEFVAVLQTLQRIAAAYTSTVAATSAAAAAAAAEFSVDGFAAPLVRNALRALPAIQDAVVGFLERINGEAARRDDKYAFFRESEETEAMTNHKVSLVAVEMELEEHRRSEIADVLGKKKGGTGPAYVTVAGIEYLVEVPNPDLRRVPASWIKVSGTKRASRFHTPTVVRLLRERDQHREALAAACDAAFQDLLREVAACYQPLRDAVAALATLDVLLSLARVAALPGYCKPEVVDDNNANNDSENNDNGSCPLLEIVDGRHPVAEHTLPGGYIPFSVRLGGDGKDSASASANASASTNAEDDRDDDRGCGPRALLVTGPNMGGKSSFVRAVALLTLLAQIGSYVPAARMRLALADAIFTRMGARDNLFAGESTFMVEVSETAAILRAATPRSLVVLDELGRGTSTHDGAAIAQAVLAHVATETRCRTLFITHYQSLARVADGLTPRGIVQNVHMRFTATKSGDGGGGDGDGEGDADDNDDAPPEEITFLYEVGQGMAHRSYGLNVARLARIPPRVLAVAAQKSREMEEDVRARRLRAAARLVGQVLGDTAAPGEDQLDQLDHLVSSIEQL
ncbi:MAG: Mismatch repair protein msh3 [Sporothrix thermara]